MSAAKKTPHVDQTLVERQHRESLAKKLQQPAVTNDDLLEAARAIDTEALYQQRDEARARALKRGRKQGAPNKQTDAVRAHIRELVQRHPGKSPPQLYGKANKKIIGDMAPKTFCDHVRALRKK